MTYIDLNLDAQDIKLKVVDNGDGTYSLVTITLSGGGTTISSVEVSNLDEIVMPTVPDTSPASNAFVITPNDSVDLTHVTRGLYIAAAGTLKVDFEDSGTVVLSGLVAGTVYPFAVSRVYSTDTTISGVVGLY